MKGKCPFGGSSDCAHFKQEYTPIKDNKYVHDFISYCDIASGDCIGKCPENLLEYEHKNINLKFIDEHLNNIKCDIIEYLYLTSDHLFLKNILLSVIAELRDLIEEIDIRLNFNPLDKLEQMERLE